MRQYIVDAFSDSIFGGNPAAVCIVEESLSDELMLAITKENNLSETAFAVRKGDKYHLRWFTPGGEIDLCGHATLATAYVLMNYYDDSLPTVTFTTMSGDLIVNRNDELYEMSFPPYDLKSVNQLDEIEAAIGVRPREVFKGRDLLCVLDDERSVIDLKPDLKKVAELDGLLLQVTAEGTDYDCVSRSFAPKLNVDEDPVCGSGHCHIIPYWSEKLNKETINAYQASARGGSIYATYKDGALTLAGKATLFAISELYID